MATLERVDLLSDIPSVKAMSIARGAHDDRDAFSGFNACHYVGDAPAHVAACRSALCAELSISADRLIIPRQTHSSRVAVIGDRVPDLEGVDALVTDRSGIALCINTADCVPIVLYDPESGICGAAHSGWRGTVAQIGALTLEEMVRLGAKTSNIRAAMGPCICGECYEVGSDVASQFLREYGESSRVVTTVNDRKHVDLPRAVALTLIRAGLPASHISMPPACTLHDNDRWPSARRLGIASARTLTVIVRK